MAAKKGDKVFDVEKVSGGYKPLQVRFRGKVYTFGQSATEVMAATDLQASIDPAQGNVQQQTLEKLPQILQALCPTFPVDEMNAGDALALLAAATEVMQRVGAIRFQAGS